MPDHHNWFSDRTQLFFQEIFSIEFQQMMCEVLITGSDLPFDLSAWDGFEPHERYHARFEAKGQVFLFNLFSAVNMLSYLRPSNAFLPESFSIRIGRVQRDLDLSQSVSFLWAAFCHPAGSGFFQKESGCWKRDQIRCVLAFEADFEFPLPADLDSLAFGLRIWNSYLSGCHAGWFSLKIIFPRLFQSAEHPNSSPQWQPTCKFQCLQKWSSLFLDQNHASAAEIYLQKIFAAWVAAQLEMRET